VEGTEEDMKKEIKTEGAPAPLGPYSQAILSGPFLFCAGQIPIDPKTNEVFKGDIKTQAQMVMENIKAVLTKADYNFDHVVKTTIFLTKMSDFATVNEVYGTYVKAPYPARSTIAVAELPKGVNVEIEVLAMK
jgi:2-iminobutanoate/2-iminopropanoate deaminase